MKVYVLIILCLYCYLTSVVVHKTAKETDGTDVVTRWIAIGLVAAPAILAIIFQSINL